MPVCLRMIRRSGSRFLVRAPIYSLRAWARLLGDSHEPAATPLRQITVARLARLMRAARIIVQPPLRLGL
eukprot:4025013-Pyramimonas_sp.AAC.1